ncbi:uncharacterized protein [Amphiura filiformis]|uniref:uncharacterized protein n=1 Tax=Amphiura filiformis TaxID=82378 RepID=UPI003B21FC2A
MKGSPSPAMIWSCLSPSTCPFSECAPTLTQMYDAKYGKSHRRAQRRLPEDNVGEREERVKSRAQKSPSTSAVSEVREAMKGSPSPAMIWSCLSPSTCPFSEKAPTLTEMYDAKYGKAGRRARRKLPGSGIRDKKTNSGNQIESTTDQKNASTSSTSNWMCSLLGDSWKTKLLVAGGVVAVIGLGSFVIARKLKS